MKKILIIEDDKMIREFTAEILELAQYEVITASNGKDGSVLAKETRPDLIVSDIMMPKLDGFGVLHILSKDPTTELIPFIFLTSKDDKSDLRKGMELGADDYLIKPFEGTELLNAIETRLRKTEVTRMRLLSGRENVNLAVAHSRRGDELETLLKSRPISRYKKKEVVFHSGDETHYLYFISKGKVKTYATHDDGKEYITNIYKTGEFFGYPCLFDDRIYPDSALVMENSEIYKIPKDDFLSLMYRSRAVTKKFLQLLSSHIKQYEKQLIGLAYDSVRKRTADALLKLYGRYHLSSNMKQVPIPITRENLAGMAGTTVETVIRCLGEFKEDDLIRVHGRNITIINNEGLKNIQ